MIQRTLNCHKGKKMPTLRDSVSRSSSTVLLLAQLLALGQTHTLPHSKV
jgi:hypothetical protein